MTSPYIIQYHPTMIFFRPLPGYRVSKYDAQVAEELINLFDVCKDRKYLVMDLSDLRVSVSDLVEIANSAARGENAYMHHLNMLECLLISPDPVIHMAAKGMRSAAFGSAFVHAFNTLEEAQMYIDSHV